MSGFKGHVKLSILNSPNNPELSDRTVGPGLAQQALLSVGSDCHFVHSGIQSKFILKNRVMGEREHQHQIQELIQENLMKQLRQLVCELEASSFLIWQGDHEDLRFKSYVLRFQQLFPDRIKAEGRGQRQRMTTSSEAKLRSQTKMLNSPRML